MVKRFVSFLIEPLEVVLRAGSTRIFQLLLLARGHEKLHCYCRVFLNMITNPLMKEVPLVPAKFIDQALGIPYDSPAVIQKLVKFELSQDCPRLLGGIAESKQSGIDCPCRCSPAFLNLW